MGTPLLALLWGLAEITAVLVVVFAGYLLIGDVGGRDDRFLRRLLLGLLFAASAIYCLTFPVDLLPGVFVAPHAALLALAGLIGGPLIAGAALIVSLAFRIWLGGSTMVADLIGSVLASAIGIGLWYRFRAGGNAVPAWRPLLLAGAGVAIVSLLTFLAVPPIGFGLALLRETGPAVAPVQFASVLLLGGLLRIDAKRGSGNPVPPAPASADDEPAYRQLAETAPAAICVTDEETGRFLFANRRAHQLLEVEDGSLLNRRMPSFYVDPQQREEVVDEIRRTGGVEERSIDVVTDGGRRTTFAVTVSPIEWQGRRSLLWAAVDMSGIQDAVRELDRQDALNRAILETLLDGLIVMCPNGNIRVFNTTAERIFGWHASEIVGRNLRLLINPPADDDPATDDVLTPYLVRHHGRDGGRREIEGRRKDGSVFPLEFAVAEIAATADNGDEPCFLGIARDVTERRRSIDALINARTEAEVAHRTQRDFLAHMSHELRTPLNSILGFSELMQLSAVGPIPDKYREYAASIHLAGDHLLRLINDILDLSKIEQGYLVLQEERVRPEELLDAVARLFKPKAEERHILLDVRPPDQPFDILGDFVRLRQILFNLVSNAIKFSPSNSKVTITVGRTAEGDILIAVADHGPGMTPAEVAIALKPFGQVRNEITRSHEGTGLGLSISKSLVERHDGRLEIDSVPGQGTTASIRLPASRALPRDASGAS